DDKGWIKTLMDEAENERMHLMTFIEVAKPTLFERFVIVSVQWVFYLFFFALYLVSSKTAHRVVGYFEEEAVISYTHYLAEIDEGRSPNVPAPTIAKAYWGLPEDATLRDVTGDGGALAADRDLEARLDAAEAARGGIAMFRELRGRPVRVFDEPVTHAEAGRELARGLRGTGAVDDR
ncbi:MAG: alternative oxidase, partial [Archangium sp.]